MSNVTNIILATQLGEDKEYLLEKFSGYNANGLPFNLQSIDSDHLPKAWYGGSKMMEANVFLGAFNYLDLDSLIVYLKEEIQWNDPMSVQLIVKKQDDYKFQIIDLFAS